MRRPFHVLPKDWAASSTTRSLCFLCDGVEPVAIDRQAGEVDRDDRARGRRDRGLDAVEVDVARDRIDVDEDRPGADFEDDVAGGDPGERRGDDLVARADAGDAQRDLHRAGAGVEGAHRAAAAILGELRLEGLHLRPGRDPAGAQHLGHAGDGLVVDGRTRERQEAAQTPGGAAAAPGPRQANEIRPVHDHAKRHREQPADKSKHAQAAAQPGGVIFAQGPAQPGADEHRQRREHGQDIMRKL
jgi:hypothetical protein